jgi:hypothetical protein
MVTYTVSVFGKSGFNSLRHEKDLAIQEQRQGFRPAFDPFNYKSGRTTPHTNREASKDLSLHRSNLPLRINPLPMSGRSRTHRPELHHY